MAKTHKKTQHASRRPALARREVERALTPDKARALQIVHWTFAAGVVLLFLIAVMLAAQPVAEPRGENLAFLLLLLGSGVSALGIFLGQFLWQSRLRPDRVAQALSDPSFGPRGVLSDEGDRLAHLVRRAWIARLAAFEAGPIICLLAFQAAAQGGILLRSPVYWIAALPSSIFLAYCIRNPPRRDVQISALLSEKNP